MADRSANRKRLETELLRGARHRAGKRGALFSITRDDVLALLTLMRCRYCDRLVRRVVGQGSGPKPGSPTLDRIWPELGYVKGNVVLACGRCNQLMGDASPEELELMAERMRRVRQERTLSHHEEE